MVPVSCRIKFTQTGILQYISHLDVDRTMKTVMARAGIPVHFTEGFNPHPKLAFGPPLSTGVESLCEYMDFKVDAEMSYEEIKERLNGALPPQMRVLEAYEPKKQLSDIMWTEYEITSENIDVSPLENGEIIVSKRMKKGGYRDTDIKPMINGYSLEGNDTLKIILSASPDAYLRPEYVIGVLGLGDYTVVRTAVYGKGKDGRPVPFR